MPLLFIISRSKLTALSKKWTAISLTEISQKCRLRASQGDQEAPNLAMNVGFVTKQVIGKTIAHNSEDKKDQAEEEDTDLLVPTHHLHPAQTVLKDIEEEEESKKRSKRIERDRNLHHLLAVLRPTVRSALHLKRKKIIRSERIQKQGEKSEANCHDS